MWCSKVRCEAVILLSANNASKLRARVIVEFISHVTAEFLIGAHAHSGNRSIYIHLRQYPCMGCTLCMHSIRMNLWIFVNSRYASASIVRTKFIPLVWLLRQIGKFPFALQEEFLIKVYGETNLSNKLDTKGNVRDKYNRANVVIPNISSRK